MKYLQLLFALLISGNTFAQQTKFCAYIVDSESNAPLIAAEIQTVHKFNTSAPTSTFSNEEGLFCIEIDSMVHALQINSIFSVDTTVSITTLLKNGDTIKVFTSKDTCTIPIYGRKINPRSYTAKPAIYLYPTQKTTVNIQHDFKGEIGTTYPAYKNGWKVLAEPNGTLLNLADNRKYEYLFWDGTYTFPATHFDYKEGFVVAKENTTEFLWKQLAHVGLNEKEINDFVVYWLPQLEHNDHNFIHFHINNDIDHSSVLTVQPQPDSWIRLFMEFKSVPANYSIPEQKLPSIKRDGFTLVEWGGAVIENSETDFE